MAKRLVFSAKTKAAVWERANGMCEGKITVIAGNMDVGFITVSRRCNAPLYVGNFHYDHVVPEGLTGGDNSLANCQVLCTHCHGAKTSKQDIKAISKAKRIAKKLTGLKKSRSPMPFGRNSKLRKKLSGEIVPRLK